MVSPRYDSCLLELTCFVGMFLFLICINAFSQVPNSNKLATKLLLSQQTSIRPLMSQKVQG